MSLDTTLTEVGALELAVHGSGRNGRRTASRFNLRCDAVALLETEMMLLSVCAAETSVKALTAALRSSGKQQQHVEYTVRVGEVRRAGVTRCEEDYRVYRARLDYGLWHVLFVSQRKGFLPILNEDSLWQHLQTSQFTTPLLREWMPWLYSQMKERELLLELRQHGCHAGLIQADSQAIDTLVSEGVRTGKLLLSRHPVRCRGSLTGAIESTIQNLDDYMRAYGALLGKQAESSLHPLHVPGRDQVPDLALAREPFAAQAHVIEALRKTLSRQKSVLLVSEMGTGKTIMALAAMHAHAQGRPYRSLVFCPGQLVNKWEREIRETLPNVEVIQIDSWKSLLHLDRTRKPNRVQWYIIARDRAKLGAKWRPACRCNYHHDNGFLRCPQCGLRLVNEDQGPLYLGKTAKDGHAGTGLWKRRGKCEWVLSNERGPIDPQKEDGNRLLKGCGSPLWQMTGEVWRYEPALYIKRRLRRFFDYLVLDEIHEEKGADTAQGHAVGALAASCRKVLALTGTLIGGYAEHLRPLLFRLAPGSLIQEDLGWSNVTAFNERYGRIETRITERSGVLGEDNRMSRGSKTTIKSVRPGIMPVLFGKHLIDKAVFLSLSEVADNLPPLEEECLPVRMDEELARAYRQEVEKPLTEAIKEMLKRKDRRLLGAMLQTLLAYPDYPFDWQPIGYWDPGAGSKPVYVTVAEPPDLPSGVLRPKEQALIDLIQSEKKRRRKVWVYVQFTDKHDVQGRLETLLRKAGLRVAVLRTSVPLARREEWIAQQAPQLDVVISHPRLVETGLELFDKEGRHNFPTLCFYETGYNLFTLRQASRRSWRIGQREACRIVYFYYEETMQDRALALMGRKLTAAQALEGKFTSEGLVAMAGEDANVEIALARSLVQRLDEGDARRAWAKITSPAESRPTAPVLLSTDSLFAAPDQVAEPTDSYTLLRRRRPSRRKVVLTASPAGLLF